MSYRSSSFCQHGHDIDFRELVFDLSLSYAYLCVYFVVHRCRREKRIQGNCIHSMSSIKSRSRKSTHTHTHTRAHVRSQYERLFVPRKEKEHKPYDRSMDVERNLRTFCFFSIVLFFSSYLVYSAHEDEQAERERRSQHCRVLLLDRWVVRGTGHGTAPCALTTTR